MFRREMREHPTHFRMFRKRCALSLEDSGTLVRSIIAMRMRPAWAMYTIYSKDLPEYKMMGDVIISHRQTRPAARTCLVVPPLGRTTLHCLQLKLLFSFQTIL